MVSPASLNADSMGSAVALPSIASLLPGSMEGLTEGDAEGMMPEVPGVSLTISHEHTVKSKHAVTVANRSLVNVVDIK